MRKDNQPASTMPLYVEKHDFGTYLSEFLSYFEAIDQDYLQRKVYNGAQYDFRGFILGHFKKTSRDSRRVVPADNCKQVVPRLLNVHPIRVVLFQLVAFQGYLLYSLLITAGLSFVSWMD